eukprot:scaffold7681_cov154-Skeletonema_menzelii.AAC.8
MNNQHDEDPDEAAARRLQEEIWMEEDQEGEGEDGNDNRLDLVRRLLRARGAANNAPAADNNNNDENNDDDEEEEDDDDNDDDDDEEDDDGEEEDDPADDDEENEEDREAIDGGVAGDVFDEQRQKITRTLKCPLVLYFECDEDLSDIAPNNPLLLHGATVYVGLDKGSKLSVIFQHYCDFVNSKSPSTKTGSRVYIKPTDLEFIHCTTLDAQHTVEASAMMKNDRIRVVRERSKDRSVKAEMIRLQRESDRKYFKELRSLLANPSPESMGCDVILECQGKVKDEKGFSQNVLATTVRANSVLIAKRCKWLGQKISTAREDMRRRVEMTIPSDEVKSESKEAERSSSQSDDEEDDIVPSNPLPAGANNNNNAVAADRVLAAEIEDDEEEEDVEVDAGKSPSNEQASTSRLRNVSPSNSVWITLQHSPQAVKLLLEYCYTNRVQALGQDAFLKASKFPNPKHVGALAAKESGPVLPFRKHEWPDGGAPTVSLHLALAGIALAEEAHMPRFSLMCEVAASKLVDYSNVIDVLAACQTQQQQTGNRLPLLRKAAMLDCVFGKRYFENPIFKKSMEARKDLVIPSVLDGSIEVFPTNLESKELLKKTEKMQKEKNAIFDMLDESDRNKRLFERIKQRKQGTVARRMEVAFGQDVPKIASPRETYRARAPPHLNDRRGTKRKGRTSSGSNASKRKRSQGRKS